LQRQRQPVGRQAGRRVARRLRRPAAFDQHQRRRGPLRRGRVDRGAHGVVGDTAVGMAQRQPLRLQRRQLRRPAAHHHHLRDRFQVGRQQAAHRSYANNCDHHKIRCSR
jgi:hypothetical protein